jgi:hypothetical protein
MFLLAILLRGLRGAESAKPLFLQVTQLVKWLLNLAAVTVLVSGAMLIQGLGYMGNAEPLYVKVMEQAGGSLLLVFIILMTVWSNRLQKRMRAEKQVQSDTMAHWMKGYSLALSVFVVLSVSVLLVVSFKFV